MTMNISGNPTFLNCSLLSPAEFHFPNLLDYSLNMLNVLLSSCAHTYVLWLALRVCHQVTSEIFMLDLSVCEILINLRSLLAALAPELPRLHATVLFLSGFAITGRLFHCLMCVERFLAVVHPVTFLKLKPLRYRAGSSAVTWMLVLVYCASSLCFLDTCYTNTFTYLYLMQFLLFLSINVFCLVSVLLVLRQSGPGERKEENHRKRRAFLIILITTVALVVIYAPGIIVAVQFLLLIPPVPGMTSVILGSYILAGLVQPVLFIQRAGKLPFCKSK